MGLRALLWLLGLVLVVEPASPQSLAELVQKERERRKTIPASKVYREEDLAAASEGSLSVTGTPSDEEKTSDSRQEAATRDRKRDDRWQAVYSTYKARFDVARAARDQYRDQYVNGIPAGAGGKRIPCRRILSRGHLPGWIEHAIACEAIDKRIEEQEARMEAIENECLEEARKRSVPPGQARLQ